MTICDRQGCNEEARWRPKLFFLVKQGKKDITVPLELALDVCGAHTRNMPLNMFLTDQVFTHMQNCCQVNKYSPPSRERVTLGWYPRSEST